MEHGRGRVGRVGHLSVGLSLGSSISGWGERFGSPVWSWIICSLQNQSQCLLCGVEGDLPSLPNTVCFNPAGAGLLNFVD